MSAIKIEKILSVSSEDPAYPADNLLKTEIGKHVRWKCKNTGELNAIVVLQLAESIKFASIDIGNCGSAFVEILVGKSCLPDAEFKVLLISTMLMTMQESKDETNYNSVTFFKPDKFNVPEASDKWDRVKIVCTQPFNKHIQYGLSFVKFYCSEPPPTTSPTAGNLGKFLLKDEEADNITPGSLFARRKDFRNDDPEVEKKGTVAASIRAAAASLTGSKAESLTPKVKKAKNTVAKARVANTSLDISSSESSPTPSKKKKTENTVAAARVANTNFDISSSESSPTPSKEKKTGNTVRNNATSDDDNIHKKRKNDAGDKTPKRIVPAPKKPKVKRTRPFGKLLEGVVFVISGFQNPLRSDIRSKGLAMGAKYHADWDRQCTHLICAFTNTPKFNQVRGRGKIVKKDWIEDSYEQRIRFPWRRYALDTRDAAHSESEDEVYEETNDSNIAGSSRDNNMSDEEEDSPRPSLFPHLKKKSPEKKDVPAVVPVSQSSMDVDEEAEENAIDSDIPDNGPEKVCINGSGDGDSTQSDSEWASEVQRECYPLPYLPEQLKGLSVFVSEEYDEEIRKKLIRYIIAHSGRVHDSFSADVEFVVTDKPECIAKLKKESPLIVGIKSEWVWRCHDENRLLPISKFEL